MATDKREQEFLELAERFRDAVDPEQVELLGNQLGRLIFGD